MFIYRASNVNNGVLATTDVFCSCWVPDIAILKILNPKMKDDQHDPTAVNAGNDPSLNDIMMPEFSGVAQLQTQCSVIISTRRLITDITDDDMIYNFHFRTMHDDEKGYFIKKVRVCPVNQWELVIAFAQRKEQLVLMIDASPGRQDNFSKTNKITLSEGLLGKLLAILLERYLLFKNDYDGGMLVLAAGDLAGFSYRMEAHVLELAHMRKMEPEFLDWIENANRFSALTNHLR